MSLISVLLILAYSSCYQFSLSPRSFSMGPFDPVPPPPPLSTTNSRVAQRVLLGLDSSALSPLSLSSKPLGSRLSPLQAKIDKTPKILEPRIELKRKLESDKMDAMSLNQINDHWKYYESLKYIYIVILTL